MGTDNELIQQLYVAYLHRPADVAGLTFWSEQLDKGVTLDAISASFALQGEYKAMVAGKEPAAVVDALYLNLFGRHADKDGLDFYSQALANGGTSVDRVVRDITAGAQGNDVEFFYNKVAASEAFTMVLGSDEGARMAYASGQEVALVAARAYVDGVTTDATLYSALGGLGDVITKLGLIGIPL